MSVPRYSAFGDSYGQPWDLGRTLISTSIPEMVHRHTGQTAGSWQASSVLPCCGSTERGVVAVAPRRLELSVGLAGIHDHLCQT